MANEVNFKLAIDGVTEVVSDLGKVGQGLDKLRGSADTVGTSMDKASGTLNQVADAGAGLIATIGKLAESEAQASARIKDMVIASLSSIEASRGMDTASSGAALAISKIARPSR